MQAVKFRVAVNGEVIVACDRDFLVRLAELTARARDEIDVTVVEDFERFQRVFTGKVTGPLGQLWLRSLTALARKDWDVLSQSLS